MQTQQSKTFYKQLMKHWNYSKSLTQASVLSAEAFVDFENWNIDSEADEEELLLLLQPHQLHLHLTLCVLVLHHKVLAAVVGGRRILRHRDVNGRADAPEGFLELVQQCQRYDAAVLRSAKKNHQSFKRKIKGCDPFLPHTAESKRNHNRRLQPQLVQICASVYCCI